MEQFFLNFSSVYILILLGQMIFVLAFIQMAYQRRSPSSMIAWLLAFFLMPYVTIPLYFFVGLRKHQYHKEFLSFSTDHTKHSIYKSPLVHEDNHFELLTTGEMGYARLMHMIDNSQETIYMTVYKLDIDKTTKLIFEALERKARSGVKVKILLDALGSIKVYVLQYKLRQYRQQGIEIAFFMPIIKMPFRNYINQRNHRKAFIFDEQCVISGGINLTDTYLGPVKNEKRWVDILFLIEGNAAHSYVEIFFADWEYATHEKLAASSKSIGSKGNIPVQVIPSGPDMKDDYLYETLLKRLYNATQRIWIVTPYFTPDEGILDALKIAKHHDVDVRLITPRGSDHIIADLGRSSFMREIEEQGVYVGLYEGPMLHAKGIIIDDTGMLGSANISYRSMFLNYETMSLFDSKEVVNTMEAWMLELQAASTQQIKHNGKLRRIGENLMKVFTPLL